MKSATTTIATAIPRASAIITSALTAMAIAMTMSTAAEAQNLPETESRCPIRHDRALNPSHFIKWTPDGSRVVLNHGRRVYAVKTDGYQVRMLVDTGWEAEPEGKEPRRDPTTPGTYADISPDGKFLAYAACRASPGFAENSEIEVLELESGTVTKITTSPRYEGFPGGLTGQGEENNHVQDQPDGGGDETLPAPAQGQGPGTRPLLLRKGAAPDPGRCSPGPPGSRWARRGGRVLPVPELQALAPLPRKLEPRQDAGRPGGKKAVRAKAPPAQAESWRRPQPPPQQPRAPTGRDNFKREKGGRTR